MFDWKGSRKPAYSTLPLFVAYGDAYGEAERDALKADAEQAYERGKHIGMIETLETFTEEERLARLRRLHDEVIVDLENDPEFQRIIAARAATPQGDG